MKNTLLVILTKAPIPGKSKTRLAAGKNMDNHSAATVSAGLIHKTFAEHLSRENYDTVVSVEHKSHVSIMKKLYDHRDYKVQPQHSDLGRRMSDTIKDNLSAYENVILIGSDCPGITHATINEAITALQKTDTVLGQATDGGFYLIGMNRHADIFSGVQYSTGKERAQTIEKISEQEISLSLLEFLTDIDTEKDYFDWLDGLSTKSKSCWDKLFQRMSEKIT